MVTESLTSSSKEMGRFKWEFIEVVKLVFQGFGRFWKFEAVSGLAVRGKK